MESPLVTVVCLCYNHEDFVEEALESVFQQTYPLVQLIIVDDASADGSRERINRAIEGRHDILFLPLKDNLGNCKAFNQALPHIKGEFFIDFSSDDVMMKDRIEKQIHLFRSLSTDYGLVFTDSIYIDAEGEFLRNHFDHLFKKKLLSIVPEGDVFADVLQRYFISTPTMMIRTEVIKKLNGYDEDLVYEDFDLWVRASRNYKFAFLNERLTKVRKASGSMSSGWYVKGDRQLLSTYKVCIKAKELTRTEKERIALIRRARYELRQSIFSENKYEAELFFELLSDLKSVQLSDRILFQVGALSLPLAWLRNLYHRLRYS